LSSACTVSTHLLPMIGLFLPLALCGNAIVLSLSAKYSNYINHHRMVGILHNVVLKNNKATFLLNIIDIGQTVRE